MSIPHRADRTHMTGFHQTNRSASVMSASVTRKSNDWRSSLNLLFIFLRSGWDTRDNQVSWNLGPWDVTVGMIIGTMA